MSSNKNPTQPKKEGIKQNRIANLFKNLKDEKENIDPIYFMDNSSNQAKITNNMEIQNLTKVNSSIYMENKTEASDQKGIRLSGDEISSADDFLTSQGRESLLNNDLVFSNLNNGEDASLALTIQLDNKDIQSGKSILLELLASSPERTWSDDELFLIKQVMRTLSLSIQKQFKNIVDTTPESSPDVLIDNHIDLQSYDDVLKRLLEIPIFSHPSLANLTINLFDHPWYDEKPEWLIPVSRWSKINTRQSDQRYPLDGWNTLNQLFKRNQPVYINHTAMMPGTEKMGNKSLIFTPINTSGIWFGQIIAIYSEPTEFQEDEIQQMFEITNMVSSHIHKISRVDERLNVNSEK